MQARFRTVFASETLTPLAPLEDKILAATFTADHGTATNESNGGREAVSIIPRALSIISLLCADLSSLKAAFTDAPLVDGRSYTPGRYCP